MGAMMGLFSHSLSSVQSLTGAGAQQDSAAAGVGMSPTTASTSGTSSTNSASSSSATISANDFLSLLVTEMQNQDPTADTDPNEYINQLVQVNSLEQLIDINQNLTTALGGSSSTSGANPGTAPSIGVSAGASSPAGSSLTGSSPSGMNPAAAQTASAATGHGLKSTSPSARSGGSGTAAAISRFVQSAGGQQAPGNLAVPPAQPASKTVAHALDGHRHVRPSRGHLPGTF